MKTLLLLLALGTAAMGQTKEEMKNAPCIPQSVADYMRVYHPNDPVKPVCQTVTEACHIERYVGAWTAEPEVPASPDGKWQWVGNLRIVCPNTVLHSKLCFERGWHCEEGRPVPPLSGDTLPVGEGDGNPPSNEDSKPKQRDTKEKSKDFYACTTLYHKPDEPDTILHCPDPEQKPEPIDVPAIRGKRDFYPYNPNNCQVSNDNDEIICPARKAKPPWTCADKSRILLTSEDGKKHCIKLPKN